MSACILGGALLNLDQLDAAFDEANRAIAIDDRYAKGYILAGRVCAAREQWDRAQSFFETAQRLDQRDPDAWYFSGRAYYDANRFEQAIARVRAGPAGWRGASPASTRTWVWRRMPWASSLPRKSPSARRWNWPTEPGGPILRTARSCSGRTAPAESLPRCGRRWRWRRRPSDVRFELARVLYHENSLDEAARVLEPALPSNECRVHNLLARIYSASGKGGAAEAEVQAIENCKAAPDSP